jgi:amino acid adenylation domain-containing protein
VAALPLTASGKLDRARLRQIEPESGDSPGDEEPPATPLEEQIAAIWAEVLEVERVGRHQSFFDLGGHSLLMARVLSRIEDRLALSLSLRAFMEGATVAQLAAVAGQVEAGEPPTTERPQRPQRPPQASRPSPTVPVPRPRATTDPTVTPPAPPVRTGRRFLLLSFAQERLWFLDQLHPRSTAYNVPWLLPLSMAPEPALLRRCLQEIVRRHAVLRTRFAVVEGQPRQQVLPSAEVPVGVVDLRGLPAPLPEAMTQWLSAAAAQQPFDVANGPHLRVTLFHFGRQQHLLAVIFHHLVADGWSVSLFQQELTSLYTAFAAGSDSPLPPLPLQYCDYAQEQRDRLASGELADQLAFWRAELADAPALLELPTDRPRPPVLSLAGGTLLFPLATSSAVGLRALSRSSGTTLFGAVLAAFSALLYRYSGQRDILVGSPTANRSRPQLETLIGFFTNTVVLRCRPEASLRFEDWVRHTGEVVLRALSHQEYPFERLVDALHSQRSLSYNPLFQVMLALHNMPSASVPVASVPSASAPTGRGATDDSTNPPPPLVGPAIGAKFDLTLNVSEAPDGMQCSLDFSTDLFDPTTAARMTQHLRVLIAGAVAQPQLTIGDLPLLPAAELRQVVVDWNRTAVDFAAPQLLHQMVERQASRDPRAVALVAGDEQMSYGRLDACAQRLAIRLRGYGVGPEVPVGVCMERSFELVVALLAVLKAGGAYVPFDPAYPPQRLASLHEQTGAPIVLVQESFRELWRDAPCKILVLGAHDLDEVGDADQDRRPLPPPSADNACYVIFTSGSTGAPKGVVIPHRAAVNHMVWMCRQWPLDAHELVLHKTAVSFDASVWEIFVPLASGARLYLAPPGVDRDPRELAGLLRRSGATVLQLVPSMAEALFAEPELARCDRLRRLFLGGEALPRALAERFFGLHSAELVNLYGPTEATIQAVVDVVPRATNSPTETQRPTAPIGRPIANLCAYVVDRRLRPLPIGIPGELLLGGAGVGRGYLQRPALTAERFIPDPFSDHQGGGRAGARLYRTGDRVRHLLDGRLEFLGREDDQVKLHGFRIEPGEIAAVLQGCPEVAEAAVVLREDRPGDPRLVAYVVPAGEAAALEPTLRRFLAERLPEHMVPSLFVLLSRLPRKPNGKLDRAALPEPGSARPHLESDYVAPATPVEEALAEIWQEVLGLDRVGANDRFFDLGGHSLLATQVLARLRETFDVDVPVRALFEQPSVAGLAAALMALAPHPQRVERIAELYLTVARMSEDEIDRRLAHGTHTREGRES